MESRSLLVKEFDNLRMQWCCWPWTCQARWLRSWWRSGWCRFGRARIGLAKEMSLEFWHKCGFGWEIGPCCEPLCSGNYCRSPEGNVGSDCEVWKATSILHSHTSESAYNGYSCTESCFMRPMTLYWVAAGGLFQSPCLGVVRLSGAFWRLAWLNDAR